MKALIKHHAGPGLALTQTPIPTIGPNDVLIKVKKTAICGTDLHIYKWDNWAQATIPVPMVVGHEFAGEIVEVGSRVQGLKIGTRVSGEGHLTCGYCRNCRAGQRHLCPNTKGIGVNVPGAFGEYLSMPAENVFVLPDNISDEMASIFDPFGNAMHTALSFPCQGEDVLITGAGPIGIMAALITQYCGARHVLLTDKNTYRLELAKKLGVKQAIHIDKVNFDTLLEELKIIEGFDIGLEMSGNPMALEQMIDHMLPGGRIALLGLFGKDITINWNTLVLKGLFLKGIYGREIFETWYKMVTLTQSGLDISGIITHQYELDEYE